MDDSDSDELCASNLRDEYVVQDRSAGGGAILAPGKRTVSSMLRVMGLSQARSYTKYHHVLSRTKWSGLEVGGILLRLVLKVFDRGEPLVFGIDETND